MGPKSVDKKWVDTYNKLKTGFGVILPEFNVWRKSGVDIVLPVFGSIAETTRCIKNIYANTHHPFKLVVVDDGSTPEDAASLEVLQKKHDFTLVHNKRQMGFPHTCNVGYRKGKNKYVCFMNSDAFPGPYWLSLMMGYIACNPQCGAVGPSTSRTSQLQQIDDYHAIRHIMNDKDMADASKEVLRKNHRKLRDCELSGFCIVVRRMLLNKFKGFNEDYGLGYGEENHFQTQMWREGYRSIWVKYSYVHHLGGTTFKKLDKVMLKEHRRRNKARLYSFRRRTKLGTDL